MAEPQYAKLQAEYTVALPLSSLLESRLLRPDNQGA